MPLIVNFANEESVKKELTADKKILLILTIYNNRACTGEGLSALLKRLNQYNVTALVADTVQQFNFGSIEAAKDLCEQYVVRNNEFFKDSLIINGQSLGEDNFKNAQLKLIKGSDWKSIHKKKCLDVEKKINNSSTTPYLLNAIKEMAYQKVKHYYEKHEDERNNLPEQDFSKIDAKTLLMWDQSKEHMQVEIHIIKEHLCYILSAKQFDYVIAPGLDFTSEIIEALNQRSFKFPQLIDLKFERSQQQVQASPLFFEPPTSNNNKGNGELPNKSKEEDMQRPNAIDFFPN